MATNLQFVPGRNAGSENPILNGYRFILNRKKDDSTGSVPYSEPDAAPG